MKKKLALLLAAVMLITAALPMNLLAATYDHLTAYSLNHGRGTLMPDTGNLISGVTGQLGPGNLRYTNLVSPLADPVPAAPYGESYNTVTSSPANSSWNTLANNGDGMYLVLEFPTGYPNSRAIESFKINLENAVWYFYDRGSNLYTNQDGTARNWNTTYSNLLQGSGTGIQNTLTTTGTHQWRAALGSSITTDNTDWLDAKNYTSGIPDGSPVEVVVDAVTTALNDMDTQFSKTKTQANYRTNFIASVTAEIAANWKPTETTVGIHDLAIAERATMVIVAGNVFDYLWTQVAAQATSSLNTFKTLGNATTKTAYASVTAYTTGLGAVYGYMIDSITNNALHNVNPVKSDGVTTDYVGVLKNYYNAAAPFSGVSNVATTFISRPLTGDVQLMNNAGLVTIATAGGLEAGAFLYAPQNLIDAFNNVVGNSAITAANVLNIPTTNMTTLAGGITGLTSAQVSDILNSLGNQTVNGLNSKIAYLNVSTDVNTAYFLAANNTTLLTSAAIAASEEIKIPLALSAVESALAKVNANDGAYVAYLTLNEEPTATALVNQVWTDMITRFNTTNLAADVDKALAIINGTGIGGNGLRNLRDTTWGTAFSETNTNPATGIAANYAEAATQWARLNGQYRKTDSVAIPYTINVSTGLDRGKTATVQFDPAVNGTGIQAGDVIIIPLAIKTLGEQNDVNYTITDSTGAVSPVNAKLISGAGARTGYTTSSFAAVANAASGRIYLNDLIIQEKSLGVLKDGTFYVIPPTGYDALVVPQNLQATFTYGLHSATQQTGKGETTYITYTNGLSISNNPADNGGTRNAVAISIRGFETSRSVLGTLRISGIALNPRTNDADLYDNIGDKYVWLWNTSRFTANGGTSAPLTTDQLTAGFIVTDMGLTTAPDQASLLAASRQQWSIGYTADPADAHYSGKTWEDVSVVTISENTYNSWYAKQDTTFTLVDENGDSLEGRVKFSGVNILADNMWTVYNVRFPSTTATSNNPFNDYAGTLFENWDKNDNGTGAPLDYPNVAFNRDGSKLTITDLYTASSAALISAGYSSSDVLAKMKLGIYLSAEANFEGEVWLQMGGPAVTDATTVEAGGMVKLADFYPPVSISTETTEVQISYQKWNVADVVITENFEQVGYSAFEAGKKVRIGLGEYGNGRLTDYLYFTPVAKADVTFAGDPNFNISEVTMVSLATGNNNIYTGITQRVIEFTVMRKSNTAGSTITLTNLEVNTNRSVPSGNYDLLVGGDSIVDNWITPNTNYLYLYDRYDIFGVVEPDYVKVVTETVNVQTQNTVRLHSGSNIIQVNGVDEEIPVPVLNVDGRMYVPLRFAAVALNVPDKNIFFDDGTRKVFIETNERTVTFQQDSPMYTINGVELSMNEGGVEAVAFIDPQTDRIYIPVRFLAYALNVSVDYDEETGDAILNAK